MNKALKKQIKLQIIQKEGKAFDCFATIKKDAYSMPSKFYASTVYYPATAEESQTFLTTIDAQPYVGTEKKEDIYKTDEFDTARAAMKWIKKVYADFLKIVL